MAAPVNTSAVLSNFQNGGKIIYEIASGNYLNVLGVVPDAGAVTLKIGRRKLVAVVDRNQLQPSRMGAQEPTQFGFKIRAPSAYASGELMKILLPIQTGTDVVTQHKFHLQVPDYAGAAAGWRITLSKCELQRPIGWTPGVDFDEWELNFLDQEDAPEPARYIAELS